MSPNSARRHYHQQHGHKHIHPGVSSGAAASRPGQQHRSGKGSSASNARGHAAHPSALRSAQRPPANAAANAKPTPKTAAHHHQQHSDSSTAQYPPPLPADNPTGGRAAKHLPRRSSAEKSSHGQSSIYESPVQEVVSTPPPLPPPRPSQRDPDEAANAEGEPRSRSQSVIKPSTPESKNVTPSPVSVGSGKKTSYSVGNDDCFQGFGDLLTTGMLLHRSTEKEKGKLRDVFIFETVCKRWRPRCLAGGCVRRRHQPDVSRGARKEGARGGRWRGGGVRRR